MSKDRDAYDLEPSDDRKFVLSLALERELFTAGARAVDTDGKPLTVECQQAYRDLNRAGLLVGTTYTGRGHRAATDWGLLK
jgi:hypothetical protein